MIEYWVYKTKKLWDLQAWLVSRPYPITHSISSMRHCSEWHLQHYSNDVWVVDAEHAWIVISASEYLNGNMLLDDMLDELSYKRTVIEKWA